MDAIIAQIHTLAKAADDEGRLAIIKALRQVQVELQNPQESLMHVANLVCVDFCSGCQIY